MEQERPLGVIHNCIDAELLAQLLDGAVDEPLRGAIEDHIDRCSRCHATLAAFGRAFASLRSASFEDVKPVEPRAQALIPGDVVADRFRIESMVGAGGMGVVYRAHDPELARDVALKMLRPSAGQVAAEMQIRLAREAKAMARVRHANVVSIFDVGTYSGGVFLAAEFIEGSTLREWLAAAARTWREVVDVFTRAGEGLAAAHAAGIVHRDFKPANVLVDETGTPYVTDFGLARGVDYGATTRTGASKLGGDVDAMVTRTGAFLGTPAYAAPEQLHGIPTPASDQFSFCVALFEAVYGRPPFSGDTLLARFAAVDAGRIEPVPPSRAPRGLYRAIVRGLAPNPADRHRSMEALLGVLRRVRQGWLRRGAPIAFVALVGAAASIGYGVGDRDAEDCNGFAARLDGVWDGGVRAELYDALAGHNSAAAAEAARLVAGSIDAYAQRWIETAERSCEKTRVHKEQSELSYDLQLRCLNHRLAAVTAAVELASSLPADAVHRSIDAAASLPDLAQCETLDPRRDVSVLLVDPEQLAIVDAAQEKLVRAHVYERGGEFTRADALAREALEAARTVGHGRTEAEALLVLASYTHTRADPRIYEAALVEALTAAARSGADRFQAMAYTRLAYTVGVELDRYDEGERYAGLAMAHFEHLTGEPHTVYALNALGAIATRRGDRDRADEIYTLAREIVDDDDDIIGVLSNHAHVKMLLGDVDEALVLAKDAYALELERLGVLHPSTIGTGMNLAIVSQRAGAIEDAAVVFEQAAASAEALGVHGHRLRVRALANLGVALTDAGRPEEALRIFDEALELVHVGTEVPGAHAYDLLASKARAHQVLGNIATAAELHRDALARAEARLPAGHEDLVEMQHALNALVAGSP